MSGKSARQIAFEVLFEVNHNGAYSNILLSQTLREVELSSRDKAFVTNLVYGVLRHRALLDDLVLKFSDRSLEKIDRKLLEVLRMGAFQLQVLKAPAHAAVNESVELAKIVAGKSTAGFANAILRGVSQLNDSGLYSQDESSIKYSTPGWIINAFRDVLKNEDEVIAQLQADIHGEVSTLIAWPGRSSISELIDAGGVAVDGAPNAVTFTGNPGDIPAIRERRAGVQDLGSQLVVERFFETGEPGMRWLDLCAGPGGKAAYLDSLIADGEFVANEISEERSRLVHQVVRSGKVINHDGRNLPSEYGDFDRILIDAPCTGIGALRRRPEIKWRRTPEDLPGLLKLQEELLNAAAARLRSNGVIGFATCSPHQAETKWQIKTFLKRNPKFSRLQVGKNADPDGDMQLWTFRDKTDAMFLSLLQLKV